MFFLNPAFLLGLLAATIPIIIHLINRRKLKQVEFSTLMFLKSLQKNKIRNIKIKYWLLLALRVLIILFVVTAFAGPVIKGKFFAGKTANASNSVVFIIDDSFSNVLANEKGTLLNQSKSKAKEVLNFLSEGDEAAVLFTSDLESKNLTKDFSSITKELDDNRPSYIPGDLNKAVYLAGEILAEGNNVNKHILVFSDAQTNAVPKDEEISNLSTLLKNINFVFFTHDEVKLRNNLSLTKVQAQEEFHSLNKPSSFKITVFNSGSNNIENKPLSLFFNDERVAQQSISLKAGETKTFTLQGVLKKGGFNSVKAVIDEDELGYDNNVFTSIYVNDKLNILIASSNAEDMVYISAALEAFDRVGGYNIDAKQINEVNPSDIQKYNSIIVVGSGNSSIFKDYLNNKGGMLVFPSSSYNAAQDGNFYKELGIASSVEARRVQQPVSFTPLDMNIPLFQNIFEKKNSDVESPLINNYYKAITSGKRLINLQNGDVLLQEINSGKGKVLQFFVAPDLQSSNFPLKPIFPALLNRAVNYIASSKTENEEFFTGNDLNISLQNVNSNYVEIVTPKNVKEVLNTTANQNYVIFENADVPGSYKVQAFNKEVNNIPVNYNTSELRLNYLSKEKLNSYFNKLGLNEKPLYAKIDDDVNNVMNKAIIGSELWNVFIILALLLALIEMYVAKTSSKKDVIEKELV